MSMIDFERSTADRPCHRRPVSCAGRIGAVAAAILTVLSLAQPTLGQSDGAPISLQEAVKRTLRNSFALQLEQQVVEQRRGTAQEAGGLFDPTLFYSTNFEDRRLELLSGSLDNEVKRRVPAEFAGGFGDFRGFLHDSADRIQGREPTLGSLLFDDCTETETRNIFEITNPLDPTQNRTVTLCTNADGVVRSLELGPGFSVPSSEALLILVRVQRILDIAGLRLGGTIDDLLQELADSSRNIQRDLRLIADILRINRARLGGLPSVEQFLDFSAEFGQTWKYRNGLGFTLSMRLNSREDNFEDKALIPAFGDTTVPNLFSVTGGMRLDVPLGQGRGRIATGGPEQAAYKAVEAEQQLYVFTATNEALRTVSSYWSLAALQAQEEILAESVGTQGRILEATRALIDADELPGVEASRSVARYAQTAAQLAATRRQVVQAQFDLLAAMGETASGLASAPRASESLPGDAGEPDEPTALIDRALDQRADLAATTQATEATRILERTARANLRRIVDLTFTTSFTAFEEGFDNRFYELDGFSRALSGEIVGPSYGVFLSFKLPFKNRTARGKLIQARSQLAQSQINEADLDRQIRLQIHELTRSIEEKRAELVQQQESMIQLQASLDSSEQLFQAGEITLIDLLTTEEQLTQARLALVRLRGELAQLESSLRFETGELLTGASGEEIDPTELELAPWGGS